MDFSGQTVVVVAKDQVSCDVSGEVAILNLKSGLYFGLDLLGTQVWKLLQKPLRVAEIQETVLREYEVEPEQCERDLKTLLENLFNEGLIEVREGPSL